jgi:hypothetical protein
MAYSVQYQRDAGAERDYLRNTYGQSFREGYDQWVNSMATRAAENDKFEDAGDLPTVLDDALDDNKLADWKRSWQVFQSAGFLDRVKAFLSVLQRRRPPQRALILENHSLPGLGGVLTLAVRLYVEIDDVNKKIVIRMVEHLK